MTIKINRKVFSNFHRALTAPGFTGMSANDAWNQQKFGITNEQYRALASCAEAMLGMDARKVTLDMLNRFLAGEKVCLTYAQPEQVSRVIRAFAG